MEVIVDDTQLSLAIGKKGQNVRLAAKLLGWRIDIKSEEEKRQEVESQMAALVVPGAPVSVLVDHGVSDVIVGKLMEAGVATVEKLGGMTPEDLEAIPGIEPEMVEAIQLGVNSYYVQFEESVESPAEKTEPAAEAEPAEAAESVADDQAAKAEDDSTKADESEVENATIESAEEPVAPGVSHGGEPNPGNPGVK
jgi:N utilization substance protein A